MLCAGCSGDILKRNKKSGDGRISGTGVVVRRKAEGVKRP